MQKNKSKLVEDLKKHLNETSDENLKKEWEEVEEWKNVDSSVEEFLKNDLNNFMHKYDIKSINFGRHKLNRKNKNEKE
jgi:hypothetical protein